MRLKSTAFLSALVAAMLPMATALAAPGDYNGDGRSDLSVALTNRAPGTVQGSTTWLTRTSLADANSFLFFTWTRPADALVQGDWNGDGKTLPGIVSVTSIASPLEWRIKTDTAGSEAFLQFGSPGMIVPPQCDVDGDGITDLTVIAPGTVELPAHATWYTALSGSGGQVLKQIYGLKDDLLWLADADGDGVCEKVALRKGSYTWFISEFFSSDVAGVAATQWGLDGDIPLPPFDNKLAVVRRVGNFQVAFIRNADGSSSSVNMGFATAIPMVGNYTGQNDLAWAQRDSGFFAIRQPSGEIELGQLGIPQNAHITATGVVFQPTDDGLFPASAPKEEEVPTGTSSCSRSCASTPGCLWKPIAEGGPGAVMLFSRNLRGVGLKIEDTAGNIVASTVRAGCCHNGNREHRWLNLRGAAIASRARANTGSPTIIARLANGQCMSVSNPAGREE